MAWKKVTPEVVEYLGECVAPYHPEMKKMFGSTVYFINNNMFAGVHEDKILIRLPGKDREELYSEFDEAAPFEPFRGRQMREYAALPETIYHDRDLFEGWLKRSFEFTSKLPPKEKKPRKRKK